MGSLLEETRLLLVKLIKFSAALADYSPFGSSLIVHLSPKNFKITSITEIFIDW